MFLLIKKCLHECRTLGGGGEHDHKKCNIPLAGGRFSTIYPTRLIDVGSTQSSLPPRLVEVSTMDTTGSGSAQSTGEDTSSDTLAPRLDYACLSYCWGQEYDTSCLLREDNMTVFMQKLPPLPKTIQDAVAICRNLGVRYLWVDALCILQGAGKQSHDWEKEATNVGSYYSNALFTIAATWSDNNNGGCLPYKRYSRTRHFLRTTERIHCDAKLDFSGKADSFYHYNKSSVSRAVWSFSSGAGSTTARMRNMLDEIRQYPLVQRGWVTQELSLSSRILYFTKSQCLWFCRARLAGGRWSEIGSGYTAEDAPMFWPQGAATVQDVFWETMVVRYSAMKLSFPSDRLPAISGLCKYLNADGKETYLAGIWASKLAAELAWHTSMPWRNRSRSLTADDLPTWSPFVSGSQVLYATYPVNVKSLRYMDDEDYHLDKICTFESADMKLRYDDPYGQIHSGKLTVSAFCVDMEVDAAKEGIASFPSFEERIVRAPVTLYLDTVVDSENVSVCAAYLLCEHYRYSAIFILLEPDEDRPEVYRRVGLLTLPHADFTRHLLPLFDLSAKRKITLI